MAGQRKLLATDASLDPYITRPKVYVLGRQAVVSEELARFLEDEGLQFTTDTEAAA